MNAKLYLVLFLIRLLEQVLQSNWIVDTKNKI